ncbi:DinB family protein [Paenarthrobacter sp. CM16]|uniref:DinB family protein n=1 Tax=Paenarthrobacter sp. CM16 TaxID=2738447 RepID=UPI001551F0B2|nr:DinB family protein [Paenarthrobacter sp. CM16]NQD89569.1 DinB family protein [Paenarthrobacter sp. CM16]
MTIVPDEKDWTWVLSRPCPECGFDAASTDPSSVSGVVRGMLPRWRAVLERDDVAVRPEESTWSRLEYACHVRDVYGVFDERLKLMLTQDDAIFADWDQDRAAIDGDYANQDPAKITEELISRGESIADAFAAVERSQWGRTGMRSNGSAFTMVTFAQYFLHDGVHHLHDVESQSAATS